MTTFISHSSRDHAAVRLLVQNLQTAHESAWLDQSLVGGDAWWQRILHQIRSCSVFMVALSNNCLQSKPCRAEIDYAKALGLPILPVLIGDVDSYRIDPIFTVQSVDFRNPDVAAGAALIAAVRERAAEHKELPNPLPEPPPVPYEYLQRLGVAIDSPDELSPTEQTTILLELRRALRDEDDETVRADITRLLRALRRRSEATHTTVADIDELLSKEPTASADSVAPAHAPEAVSADASGKPPTPTEGSTAPSTPGWRQPKTIAIAAAALLVVAIVAVVGYLLVGQTSPGSATSKPASAPAAPSNPPAAPASAAAANQMNGHYIETQTDPSTGQPMTSAGQPVTNDWYFTPCGDGCASASVGGPNAGAVGQARLVNGQWTIDTAASVNCVDGTHVPNVFSSRRTWDPNTLAGALQQTYKVPACGNPAGYSETFNIQLRKAP
jgi:serine/threonine kinase PknH